MSRPHLGILCLILGLGVGGCAHPRADAVSTLYLVRHAEKAKGDDPELTEAGRQRADDLADLLTARLEEGDLSAIYSTEYRRTQQTAAPLAARSGSAVQSYDPRDLPGFAQQLSGQGGTVLIVGHSNTTPQLAEALGCGPQEPIVEATEYDRLYRVERGAETVCMIERFGR